MDISDAVGTSAEAKARTFASLIELKHEHLIRTGKPRRRTLREGGLRSLRRQLTPEDFETIGVLGRGAFAEVTLSRKRDTGAIYAVKRMLKADLVQRGHVERAWTEWMVQSEADGNEWLVKLCAHARDTHVRRALRTVRRAWTAAPRTHVAVCEPAAPDPVCGPACVVSLAGTTASRRLSTSSSSWITCLAAT